MNVRAGDCTRETTLIGISFSYVSISLAKMGTGRLASLSKAHMTEWSMVVEFGSPYIEIVTDRWRSPVVRLSRP